jgi:hypothetical protein
MRQRASLKGWQRSRNASLHGSPNPDLVDPKDGPALLLRGARPAFSNGCARSQSGGAIPMLTITTTAPSAMKVSGVSGGPLSISGLTSQFGISLALGFVGLLLAALYSIKLPSCFGFPALVRARGLAVILLSLFATADCSGGNSRASAASTPSGTSTIIVTGISGTLSNQTTISLMVN